MCNADLVIADAVMHNTECGAESPIVDKFLLEWQHWTCMPQEAQSNVICPIMQQTGTNVGCQCPQIAEMESM
jgi:hypothetical protein